MLVSDKKEQITESCSNLYGSIGSRPNGKKKNKKNKKNLNSKVTYRPVAAAAAAAGSLQSCPTLCDPIDSSQKKINK